MNYKTRAEEHWAGQAGNEWNRRSWNQKIVASRLSLFSKLLNKSEGIETVLEVGPNVGQSMYAVKMLLPDASLCGIEINHEAAAELKKNIPSCEVVEGSLLDEYPVSQLLCKYDFVYTSGVLIHMSPDVIEKAYERIYNCSSKYIGMCEYYNPTPVEVNYRGNLGILFKRDFPGEMMNKYPDLELVDYGFVYHRDNNFPQDDINWFLLKKK